MAEIEAQVRQLVKTYSCISADKQNLFQSERVIIGKCPRCSENAVSYTHLDVYKRQTCMCPAR